MAKMSQILMFVLATGLMAVPVAPILAQNSTLGDFGVPLVDRLTKPGPTPSSPAEPPEANRPQERLTDPPQRLEGDAEAPPPGCQLRENKLELVV